MSSLERNLLQLCGLQEERARCVFLGGVDVRAKIIVTLLYMSAILSTSLYEPTRLPLYFIYPVVVSTMAGVGYKRIFVASMMVLPFVAMVAMFNPMLDKGVAFYAFGISVSRGWASFISLLLRGILLAQGVAVLMITSSLNAVCAGLSRLGVPVFFSTLIAMIARYISIIAHEAMHIRRACVSRGYGRTRFPIRLWAMIVVHLLLRGVDRAKHISFAMKARGFIGRFHSPSGGGWRLSDTVYLLLWASFFVAIRFLSIH